MSPAKLMITTYTNMLKALSVWLSEAPGGDAILSAQLAPDMFPLSTQIRFSCLQAYEGLAYLREDPMPPLWHMLLEEGRNANEAPGTLDEAHTRIADTITMVAETEAGDLDDPIPHAIALKLPDGRIFDMTADEYVRDWAIPQFYFHVMTAYSILRSQGVRLGKADYVQHAFAYLRRSYPD